MAIEILNNITLPSGTYTFYCPDWLKTYLLQYPTSSHSWGNEAVTGSYEMYTNSPNTFPFSYQYASPSGTYNPSSPANITLQTGITGNYFNWPTSAASSVATTMNIFINGSGVGGPSGGGNNYNRWSWYFGIDEDTQKGYCWRVLNFGTFSSVPNEYNTGLNINGYSGGGTYELYCFLKDIVTPSISWSPVSSITGKLGTVNLTKLININNGEAVTNAPSTSFNATTKSLVNSLISNVVIDDTKVGVEYNVPSGSYEYTKLVYKQDEEPLTVDDGTAIDIEVGDGIASIDGIADGNTYFFKIFTDSTASEAFEFMTTLVVQTIKVYKSTDVVYLKRNASGDPIAKTISDISAYGIEQGYGGNFALLDTGNSRNGLLVRFINITGDTIYFADEEWLGQQYEIGYNAEEGSYTVNKTLYGAMSNGTITAFSVSATGSTKTIDEMQFIYFGGNSSGNAALQGFYVTDAFTHVNIKTPRNPVHKGRYTTNPNEIIKVYTYSYSTPTYTNMTCAQILQAIKDTDPSYNQNAVGFMTIPGDLEEGTYEVQALDISSGDDIYITNYFPGYTNVKGNTSYIYIYVTNSISSGVRSRQYTTPVYSSDKYTFNGYRNAYFSTKTYEGNQYKGKGKDTYPTYTGVTLYFDPQYFGNIYYNGTKVN